MTAAELFTSSREIAAGRHGLSDRARRCACSCSSLGSTGCRLRPGDAGRRSAPGRRPWPGFSILMTSAPSAASSCEPYGPAPRDLDAQDHAKPFERLHRERIPLEPLLRDDHALDLVRALADHGQRRVAVESARCRTPSNSRTRRGSASTRCCSRARLRMRSTSPCRLRGRSARRDRTRPRHRASASARRARASPSRRA